MPSISDIGHYRMIVFSNFMLKVITKIFANRLATIVSRVISQNQFDFIQGRNNQHCVAGSSKCSNVLQASLSANMSLKINIRKAFDTIR